MPNLSRPHTCRDKTMKHFNAGNAFNVLVPCYFLNRLHVFKFYLTLDDIPRGWPKLSKASPTFSMPDKALGKLVWVGQRPK